MPARHAPAHILAQALAGHPQARQAVATCTYCRQVKLIGTITDGVCYACNDRIKAHRLAAKLAMPHIMRHPSNSALYVCIARGDVDSYKARYTNPKRTSQARGICMGIGSTAKLAYEAYIEGRDMRANGIGER
jgi:hypothetical protein